MLKPLRLQLSNINRQATNGSKFAILAHGVIKMTIYINNIYSHSFRQQM